MISRVMNWLKRDVGTKEYRVEFGLGILPEHRWVLIVSPIDGEQKFVDLDDAIISFSKYRSITGNSWPMRIVDSEEFVYISYDPENNMLAKKFHKATIERDQLEKEKKSYNLWDNFRKTTIEKNAYHLWEQAGRPDGDGLEFWLQAERALNEDDGLFYSHEELKQKLDDVNYFDMFPE